MQIYLVISYISVKFVGKKNKPQVSQIGTENIRKKLRTLEFYF